MRRLFILCTLVAISFCVVSCYTAPRNTTTTTYVSKNYITNLATGDVNKLTDAIINVSNMEYLAHQVIAVPGHPGDGYIALFPYEEEIYLGMVYVTKTDTTLCVGSFPDLNDLTFPRELCLVADLNLDGLADSTLMFDMEIIFRKADFSFLKPVDPQDCGQVLPNQVRYNLVAHGMLDFYASKRG